MRAMPNKQSKKLTLSIVIPAYNEEGYLKACLESIAQQTVKPDEVVVVDNNSTDDTIEVARSYKGVRIIREATQGVFYASTRGFRESKGDVIARIDADSILPSDWSAKVLNDFFDENVVASTGPVNYYDMPMPKHNYWFDHIMRKFVYKYSPQTPFLYGSNMAVRKSAWQQVAEGLCTDRDIHEDIDLAVHLYLKGLKIKYNKDLLSGASGRRYNDGAKDFKDYITMYKNNYSRHDLHGKAVLPALFMWTLGYVLVHPWRSLWYALHRRFYITPQTTKSRKNPMAAS